MMANAAMQRQQCKGSNAKAAIQRQQRKAAIQRQQYKGSNAKAAMQKQQCKGSNAKAGMQRYRYPEWPHRQGGCLACCGCMFNSHMRHSGGTAHEGGGATSQLDLLSLTQLSVAGCG